MITVILVIHVILAICIILAVLMQKSEGGGLGIGGSSAGGGFMTARGTANFMTKLTAFLGGCFFLTSIVLALLSSQDTPSISNEVMQEYSSSAGHITQSFCSSLTSAYAKERPASQSAFVPAATRFCHARCFDILN